MEWLLPVIIILLGLSGLPLYIVIVSLAMWGFYLAEIDLFVIAIEIYRLTDIPILSALPLFTFAGYLLSESKTSERLVAVSKALLGWLPAGLAIVTLLVSAIFTAFTGATGATIVALGALLYPALVSEGYRENFSLGLVTTSGSLGLLIPPALPLILYGVIAQQLDLEIQFTLQDLLVAGIIPALLMVFLLSVWAVVSNRQQTSQRVSFSWQRLGQAAKQSAWELPLVPLVLIGVYSGFFTLSEIAVISCVYLIIVEVFVYKEIPVKRLTTIGSQAMVMSGGIMIVLAVSLALANWMVDQSLPQQLFEWTKQYVDDKLSFLILLNIILLVLGAVLDIFSALVIMVPLILPVAASFGIHPVHLGIIFLANMQIGYLTPPIGMNLFIASYRFGKPIGEIFRSVVPFILLLLLALLMITYIPQLSLMFVG
ncbi:TRAP transporter large permease [Aliikangiella marina]|uniref:TRAP transporter large permease protein n=1 Tax=Aliikangiella marina TaxID=1712262 RepID=A0A545TD33_9GAMM|nr:TRAP transporter large permease [Aliikangiella marina]TQV75127.1 TRAP transporter large permease [Aliikangiella marina]